MALPMGGKRPGSGRKPGTPNKVTSDVKVYAASFTTEAIDYFVNVGRDDTAPVPSRLDAWNKVLDRAIGKPAQAITGDKDNPIEVAFTFKLDRPGAET